MTSCAQPNNLFIIPVNPDLPIIKPKRGESKRPSGTKIWVKNFQRMKKNYSSKTQVPCEVQICWETCPNDNAFYGDFICAVLFAYNYHKNLQLMPDDIWFLICLNFSKFVNKNSEKLRPLLVNHQGQIKLEVTDNHFDGQQRWDDFFVQMRSKLSENTKEDIITTLSSNFSTSNFATQMLSVGTLMEIFKKYFKYGRMIPACGLRNVLLGGTLEDWEQIKNKLQKLNIYPGFETYVQRVSVILDKMIESVKGNVDVEWWNKIMNSKVGSIGSGSTTYISGWINHLFYDVKDEATLGDFVLDHIEVPVQVDDKTNPSLSGTVYIFGGFNGYNEVNETVNPILSMAIISDLNTRSGVKSNS